jgi:hypothetical protein
MKSFISLIKVLIIIFIINHYIKKTKKQKKLIKKPNIKRIEPPIESSKSSIEIKTKNITNFKDQMSNEIETSEFLKHMADNVRKENNNINVNEIEMIPKINEDELLENNSNGITSINKNITKNFSELDINLTKTKIETENQIENENQIEIETKIESPLLDKENLDEINKSFNNDKIDNLNIHNNTTINSDIQNINENFTDVSVNNNEKQSKIKKLIPDKWIYKNENPMNGGNFGGGIVGFDHMDSIYEAL